MSVGIDYNKLENNIYKKAYKLSEVQDKIVRVAFDVVRFKDDDNTANLWQIQSSDDGEYIVALYDTSSEEMVATASSNPWTVVSNGLNVSFYYKNFPIAKIASSKLGLKENSLRSVSQFLPKRLVENKKLVTALLKEVNNKEQLFDKFPELKG